MLVAVELTLVSLCLCISRARISMYDVLQQPEEPELRLQVTRPGTVNCSLAGLRGETAVSFDFGAPHGWDTFAVYVLSAAGFVHVYCPIVPRHCVVSEQLLNELGHKPPNMLARRWFATLTRHNPPAERLIDAGLVIISPPTSVTWQAQRQGPMRMHPADKIRNYGSHGCRISVVGCPPQTQPPQEKHFAKKQRRILLRWRKKLQNEMKVI